MIWTIEQRGGVWVVETEDGEVVRRFDSEAAARDWLDLQQLLGESLAQLGAEFQQAAAEQG